MYPEAFTYHRPTSLDEAVRLLAEHGDEAKLLAGGHSLLPTMKLRLAAPAHLIDMKGLRDSLRYIRESGDHLAIGALTTHAAIAASDTVRRGAPLLAETAEAIGDMQVRNLGTLGGSVAHADPAGDFPAAVLAAGAELVVRGAGGERTIAADEFFHGFFETAIEAGEILTEVRVPKLEGGSCYQKFHNPASGYAVCGVAVVLTADGDKVANLRVGVTGVADGAYRAGAVEDALVGQDFSEERVDEAASHASDGVTPLEDHFANADYRRQLARVYTKRALLKAWERR